MAIDLLIVEDDIDLIALYRAMLQHVEKVTVRYTTTYRDAVAALDDAIPDLLLLDLTVPGNGMTLLELVESTHPELFVIVVSGRDDPEVAARVIQYGARYLSKPVSEHQLGAVIQIARDRRRLKSEQGQERRARARRTTDDPDSTADPVIAATVGPMIASLTERFDQMLETLTEVRITQSTQTTEMVALQGSLNLDAWNHTSQIVARLAKWAGRPKRLAVALVTALGAFGASFAGIDWLFQHFH